MLSLKMEKGSKVWDVRRIYYDITKQHGKRIDYQSGHYTQKEPHE